MHPEPKSSSLPLILSVITLGGILLFLILISGGFFLWVLFGCFLMFLMGSLHYFLWGHRLHQQTEGDREEERARQEAEQENW